MKKKMKCLPLKKIGLLEVEERPVPEPGPSEALVKVAYCGVCGSDIPRIFEKGTYKLPTVCGHEFAGTVEALGPECEGKGFKEGDHAAVFPLLWCGSCEACEEGRYVQCSNYDYYGSRRDGGFAEYVSIPLRNLVRVPSGVRLDEASMAEPAAVALHAVGSAGSAVGKSAAVFGAGPIGLMAAQWLRASGAAKVAVFDVVPEKLKLAKKLGFELAFDGRHMAPPKRMESLSGGRGAEIAIDAAGVPSTLLQAMECAASGGDVVILGNPSAAVSMEPALISRLMRREVSLHGVWNSEYKVHGGGEWTTALEAMAEGRLELKSLVSHVVSLEEAPETLRRMRERDGLFIKVLVKP